MRRMVSASYLLTVPPTTSVVQTDPWLNHRVDGVEVGSRETLVGSGVVADQATVTRADPHEALADYDVYRARQAPRSQGHHFPLPVRRRIHLDETLVVRDPDLVRAFREVRRERLAAGRELDA
jgi:hypothetical protein